METLILPTLAFIALAVIAIRQSRGPLSLPSIILLYLCCTYCGGLRLWFQHGSSTYLYVLCATAAFVAGLWLARRYRLGRTRIPALKRIPIDPCIHPKMLFYTLVVLTSLSLVVSIYWFLWLGIPIISGNPSVNWVESTAGMGHRLLVSIGGENLGFCAIGWYVLYKLRPKWIYLLAAIGCLGGAALFGALEGSKGSAVTTLLWFAIATFYFSRRTPRFKTFALMAVFALPLTWWVVSHYLNVPGETPVSLIADRVTTTELSGLNFLVQTWVPRFGHLHGQTYRMDLERIRSQFFGGYPSVLFHEYIWNLMNGAKPYDSLKLSESLSLFGVQYANFGLLGASVSLILFGIICELVNEYLLSVTRLHFLVFIAGMYATSSLFTIFIGGDILVLGVEAPLIYLLPKLIIFVAVYCSLALPFRIPLKWLPKTQKGRASLGSETTPAPAAGAISSSAKAGLLRTPVRGL